MSEAQTEAIIPDIEVSVEMKNIIETLIFACDEPMTVRMIRGIIDEANKDRLPHEQLDVNADIIRKAVGDLNRGYGRLGSGFRIIEIAGGFVFATQEQFATWVGKLAKERARRRLSPTAVETLAIIAYKQPITKSEVEFIRGVNVDYIINALLEKDLIHITGRQNTPGRPLLYGTTQKFLEHFGLNELTDLPKPREIAELISETEIEVDRRLLAEQQELEFRESLENKLEGHEGTAKKEKMPRHVKVKVPDGVKAEQAEQERAEKKNGNEKPQEKSTDENAVPGVRTKNKDADVNQVAGQGSVDTQDANSMEDGKNVILSNELKDHIDHADMNAHTVLQETVKDEDRASNVEVLIEQERTIPVKDFGEEGAVLSINSNDIPDEAVHPQSGTSEQPNHEHGWSKWKNKVKTFFRKLFG